MERDAQSDINIVNEIMKRGACDRQHASSSQSISIALRFWWICLTHSFFFTPVINCLQNMIDVLVPWTGGLSTQKKKECHSRSTFMIDARGLAMNIEDSYLSFISDSFIIRILFVQCL